MPFEVTVNDDGKMECLACEEESTYLYRLKYPLCRFHYEDIRDPELIDDLAREIYIEGELVPKKKMR